MNTQAYHFSDEFVERYAMGALSDQESAPFEEHLLLCESCRAHLKAMDEFVEVANLALATSSVNRREEGRKTSLAHA